MAGCKQSHFALNIMQLVHIMIILFSINLTQVECKYIEGELETRENWEFIARFCFKSDNGNLTFWFEYPTAYGVHNLLLYYDDQWDHVYQSNKNCTEKENALNKAAGQFIPLTMLNYQAGCNVITVGGVQKLRCSSERTFLTARARWWFIAIDDCTGQRGLKIKYKLWLANGKPGDFFYEHFSADEFYILQVDIAFMALYLVMLVLVGVVSYKLRRKQLFHTTYKMFVATVVIEELHLLLATAANCSYATTGIKISWLVYAGRVFESLAHLVFLLMLILMAKGYTITRGRLSRRSSIIITVFFTVYTVVFIVLFIYEAYVFDPGLVLYTYESPAGYGIVVLRIIAWLWFCYSIFFTLKQHTEKHAFYLPFFLFYTFWFWMFPIIVFIMAKAVGAWMREKVANGIDNMLMFLALFYFLVLTWPSKASKNFPYHVRTSQIGVLGAEQENFTAQRYLATSEAVDGGPMNLSSFDIFTVNGTAGESKEVPASHER